MVGALFEESQQLVRADLKEPRFFRFASMGLPSQGNRSATIYPRQIRRIPMPEPRITVLMPVFNGGEYVGAAIQSILGQTFGDFEFLIIDDGSTDASPAICRSYRDPRIRWIGNGENLGLIATLNKGLDLARGEYVARMDCDDISFPERFARQIEFMDRHPEIGLCGTWYERDSNGGKTIMKPAAEDHLIRFYLIFDTVFAHNTIFFRRDILERYRLRYDPHYKYAEDYEFWVRCSRHTRLANIPEVLLRYHYHSGNTSNQFKSEQVRTADRIRGLYLPLVGLTVKEVEQRLHNDLVQFRFKGDLERLKTAGAWLVALGSAARRNLEVPWPVINQELGRYWYGACAKRADLGLEAWRVFNAYPVGARADWTWKVKLLARSILRRKT